MLFLGYTGTTAFYLATMDEWFFRFVIPESVDLLVLTIPMHALPHGTTGIAAAILLGFLNARGTEESGTFQVIVTGAKVAVLFAFIGGAFAFQGPTTAVGTFAGTFQPEPIGIVSIAALAFITFFGFSAIAASAGEIIEPRKTVPKAIAASIVTVTILYALVIIAMVNSPIPAEVIAQEGETAMGRVASAFLGPIGQSLIVAGAIFSMVSASNASILAASGIGSLMGRQGQAPRRFSRIHTTYGTPFWSVMGATWTIVALIVAFIMIFPHEGGLAGIELGLEPLTGFATLNLLLPLSIVNGALIYSRRRYPDIERGFTVPGSPVVPILGIIANLALIYNLPFDGVVAGLLLIVALFVAYLIWGGAPHVEDLYEEVVSPGAAVTPNGGDESVQAAQEEGRPTILVPVANPQRAPMYVQIAQLLGSVEDESPLVRVVNVTHLPEQTPNEMVTGQAEERADEIEDLLADADLDVQYTVEAHVCQDIAFDILETARNGAVDRILMGYPEEHHDVAERIEYNAPCDVVFASGFDDVDDFSTVNIGAGGGPHHKSLLPLVDKLGAQGSDVHVISVDPKGEGGTPEAPEETLQALPEVPSVEFHTVAATSVAEGLVSKAAENGGVLLLGATRDRRLRRWVFGSTPDRVIDLSKGPGVPVLIYASSTGVSGHLEDFVYPVYRYVRRLISRESPVQTRPSKGGQDGTSPEKSS
jgi:amino acid transporter/nucleotide-binding universal stress UspA family protein